MYRNGLFLLLLAFSIVSCQFTETMVIDENGGGRMSLEMDLSEMMSFAGEMDTTVTKVDSIISMKQFLEEKKDSISQLSEVEQARLKRLENFNIHLMMDSESKQMIFEVYTDFNKVEEANDLLNGLAKTTSMIPGASSADGNSVEEPPEVLGVRYSYNNGKFARDSYIKDKELHQQQVDSMKTMEGFLNSMRYTLKYSFPRKIVKSSIEDATFSMDGKTMEVSVVFIDYFKNPDVLDLEIELEN